jgi:beta-glucanase (GH16 family)
MMRALVILIGFMLILQGLIACDNNNVLDTANPSNLEVELNIADDGSGKVEILATADNAITYALYIGADSEPEAENTSGLFEYTFLQPGYYEIEVRAYGTSGRYIKVVRQVVIDMSNDVSIEDGYYSPLTYEGYDLVWNDEFNGSEIDPANWVFETGTGCPNLCGWGNNELQFYRQENAWVEEGVLTIEARKENHSGSNYTSTRMKTQAKRSFKYGRIDIRALLPKGKGIWPALWMLGDNITSVGWPSCGEIDIMELVGGADSDNRVHGTLHWNDNGAVNAGGSYTLSNGIFADEYHVFTIIWNEFSIKWLVNDIQFHEIDITPSHMTEFHERFFFIFNVAVGGNWPGSPDETTVFPQQMKVDYVRVFQKN